MGEITPTLSPISTSVLEYTDVLFTCEFQGYPEPSVTWVREGLDLPPATRMEVASRTYNLSIHTVSHTVEH
jgi:hypothetical protein